MARKREKRASKPSSKRASRPAPRPPQKAAASQPAARWWRTPRGIVGIIAAAVVGVGAVFFAVRTSQSQPALPAFYRQGSVTNCNTVQPPFSRALGFGQNVVFDTRANVVNGIILHEVDAQGNILRSHQDESWTRGGYLGRPVLDASSNVYVVPIPAINMLSNPIERANIIYRIDAQTGVMNPYINLPRGAPANEENPYGLLALNYDCETNSLYASSVFGSSRAMQAGRIYQISLATGEVQSQLNDVDAFGVGVFNTAFGKRLYFGLARLPRVLSVSLDAEGNIGSDVRLEFTLDAFGVNTDQRVRAIRFFNTDRMQLRTVQFSFNLIAPTELRESLLEYVYDAQTDSWRLDVSSVGSVGT